VRVGEDDAELLKAVAVEQRLDSIDSLGYVAVEAWVTASSCSESKIL
jgi:hypothetical protein